MDPPTSASASPPQMISLPREIRDHIYCFLLRNADGTFYFCKSSPSSNTYALLKPECSLGLGPSILRTCKSIRAEATTVLYSSNVFRMPFHWAIEFATLIGPINAAKIRTLAFNGDIHVYGCSWDPLPLQDSISQFTSLTRLDLYLKFKEKRVALTPEHRMLKPEAMSHMRNLWLQDLWSLLQSHPTLKLAVSDEPEGYVKGSCSPDLGLACVSLLASKRNWKPGDGHLIIDVNGAYEELFKDKDGEGY